VLTNGSRGITTVVRDNGLVERIGEKAGSFGKVAESYDRVRPGPAPAAVDWLLPAHAQAAVDLAAGTGLFTRALLGRVPEITAVEPDARMRAVLAERTGGIRVLDGRGEAMPLPGGSALVRPGPGHRGNSEGAARRRAAGSDLDEQGPS
jgi:hypothetical protein